MLIIEPQVELWQQSDPIAHVARCARVCYGNKGKSTDKQLYSSLLKSGHNSMFRHESVYAIIPNEEIWLGIFRDCADPYTQVQWNKNFIYFACNGNWLNDNKDRFTFLVDDEISSITELINKFKASPEYFANTEIGHSMMRYTFHIVTQISTSRELNRVSPNNISEMSTRYVNLKDGAICRPHWISQEDADIWNNGGFKGGSPFEYLIGCDDAMHRYSNLIDQGVKKQDARGVLPLDTATEVVYTYSINEWRHIIRLRTAKTAHPNCAIVMNMVKQQLEELGYDF